MRFAREQHLNLSRGEIVAGGEDTLLAAMEGEPHRGASLNLPMEVFEAQGVGCLDPIVVRGILEGQGQHAEIDQVFPMDAGEALGQNHSQPKVTRGEGRMLAA